mmetsp:Transcript_11921/g.32238  ORF Transcript_11921/g.32238 Transcript_11921/m.32238 type:complete len:453 (-) Transcript_11921:1631-2989(-)
MPPTSADRARELLRLASNALYSDEVEEALQHLKEAITVKGDLKQDVLLMTGKAQEAKGSFDKALIIYRKVRDVAPDRPAAVVGEWRCLVQVDENGKDVVEAANRAIGVSIKLEASKVILSTAAVLVRNGHFSTAFTFISAWLHSEKVEERERAELLDCFCTAGKGVDEEERSEEKEEVEVGTNERQALAEVWKHKPETASGTTKERLCLYLEEKAGRGEVSMEEARELLAASGTDRAARLFLSLAESEVERDMVAAYTNGGKEARASLNTYRQRLKYVAHLLPFSSSGVLARAMLRLECLHSNSSGAFAELAYLTAVELVEEQQSDAGGYISCLYLSRVLRQLRERGRALVWVKRALNSDKAGRHSILRALLSREEAMLVFETGTVEAAAERILDIVAPPSSLPPLLSFLSITYSNEGGGVAGWITPTNSSPCRVGAKHLPDVARKHLSYTA